MPIDEYEFKVDDWVKTINGIDKITGIHDNNVDLLVNQFSTLEQLEKWEPKTGEWCWFWDKDSKSLMKSPLLGKYGEYSWSLEYYDYCEPFFGTLPSIEQD